MLEISGKYTTAKVFTDNIEQDAISLVRNICNNSVFANAKIRIMPDTHSGKDIVIGFSASIGEAVAPAHVGCDIGCTMTTIILDKIVNSSDYAVFEHRIKEVIPTGFNLNAKSLSFDEERDLYAHLNREYVKARSSWPDMIAELGKIDEKFISKMLNRIGMDAGVFYKSIGTLGGGNHFMEYGESDNGIGHFTVHCGSRNFGVKVFNYWNKIAKSNKIDKNELRLIIEDIKNRCTDKKQLKTLIDAAKNTTIASKHAGYLYDNNLKGYLSDMVIAQAYASFNHSIIVKRVSAILQKFNIHVAETITTTHNYIDFNDHIIRKGAIRSYIGEKMIIPFNMRDGLAICEGKSNEDWNYTAPHGAGRIMSRTVAKQTVDLDEFKKSMEGIYSTSVCTGTLDESPMAYKSKDEIVELISPTAKILYFVIPKINIKATDGAE